ncbi:MAG: PEP-CTERM/exosortase system-associated acyltransferase [Candidatus Competibacteraceae bacterium]|jgi:N-acyl amino acid synthase of PEP-CTERM/exosortase system|nr:PEP-CTERM/exosortase system-associated acyltransferase [Candidatus Competibacteraceae bacterium]
MDQKDIVSLFNQYFQLTLANDLKSREQVYRIRYQVFCEEFGYFQGAKELEHDKNDLRAQHCLLIHKDTRQPIGCFRLIGSSSKAGDLPLPFEQFCTSPSRYSCLPDSLPRGSFCECSRLATTSYFRRRKEDEKKPISMPEKAQVESDRRSPFPFIPVGLFLASLAIFLRSDYHYAFAMMEPRLSRMLRRVGIHFNQVGDVIDERGPFFAQNRAPFVFSRETGVDNLKPEIRELLRCIDKQLFDKEP